MTDLATITPSGWLHVCKDGQPLNPVFYSDHYKGWKFRVGLQGDGTSAAIDIAYCPHCGKRLPDPTQAAADA